MRYQKEQDNGHQSSCDESSCFFDELAKDDANLHNCNSVNVYNLWPKIINNGNFAPLSLVTISLNPAKN